MYWMVERLADPHDQPGDHGPDQAVEPAERGGGEGVDEHHLHGRAVERPLAGGDQRAGQRTDGGGQAPSRA